MESVGAAYVKGVNIRIWLRRRLGGTRGLGYRVDHDAPDGAGRHVDVDRRELAAVPRVAPARVLPRETKDQRAGPYRRVVGPGRDEDDASAAARDRDASA